VLDALRYDDLRTGLAAIIAPNTVFEIRCLASRRKRVDAGYFNSIDAAANELAGTTEPYQGIYITPNPVKPDLLARAMNRIKPFAEFSTRDNEIERRLWLLIDVDPERPVGISSTNLEHNRAINKARSIAGMLEIEFGWCNPMLNSSGNGAHLLYPLNEPNDADTYELVQSFLKALAHRFNEPGIKIDTSVGNAARIWRLPGTYACKGDSTAERPHRQATILQAVDEFGMITAEQMREYLMQYPAPHDELKRNNGKPKAEYTQVDKLYHFVNNYAMEHLDQWVPVYFPGARTYQQGYRVTSFELGRDKEEDLTIHPWPRGIKDFGVHDEGDQREGRRTPTMLIAEHHHNGDQEKAANALASTLKIPLSEFDPIVLPTGVGSGGNPTGNYAEVFGDAAGFNLNLIKNFADLKDRKFKSLKWIIPDVLPAGCFILAARPKMRKTWLALQLSIAVSTGSTFMQWKVNKGKVLGLMLEDNERRIKDRIEKLHTFDMDLPDLSNFHYFTEGSFPRGQDGVDVIKRWLETNPDTTFIVIDTFAHFRAHDNNRDVYLKDYAAVMPLTRLAAERDLCILVVHHEKKGLAGTQSGDFLEDVNGSSGITGGVDGIISIKGRRGQQDEAESRKLLITGRDVPHDYELDMSFDAERGGWLTAARQDVRVAIRTLLTQHPYITQTEFKALLPNTPPGRISRVLIDMKYDGEVDQNRYGYSLKRSV
jgi:hypothetical protein